MLMDETAGFVTVAQVSKFLGCSRRTVYNLIAAGTLTRLKFGSLARLDPHEVNDMITNAKLAGLIEAGL